MSTKNAIKQYDREMVTNVANQLRDMATELLAVAQRMEDQDCEFLWLRNEKSRQLGFRYLNSFVDAANKGMRLWVQGTPLEPTEAEVGEHIDKLNKMNDDPDWDN